MKKYAILTCFLASTLSALGSLVIPSDGSDGAFNPSVDTEIDLSQAITGIWSDNNTGGDIGKGIYDSQQWAVVFEYSSVNIPSGVTVTFKNHPSNAPVIWLVSGTVTIDGTVELKGESVVDSGLEGLVPSIAGPGGFRGAPGGPEGAGDGIGPGGAGTTGGNTGPVYRSGTYEYGNPQILPLIGGSGGKARSLTAGSGGGGAILIAAPNTISVDGTINSSGGDTKLFANGSERGYDSRGAGGAIRLVADSVVGTGLLDCRGGFSGKNGPLDTVFSDISGSEGRIRIEANTFSTSMVMYPETVAVLPPFPIVLFPPANAPTVKIVSVDAVSAPTDPSAPLQATSDIAILNDSPVTIVVETTNFPLEGVVQVRVGEKFGNAQWLTASYLSGTITSAQWEVAHIFEDGFSTLQARVTAP